MRIQELSLSGTEGLVSPPEPTVPRARTPAHVSNIIRDIENRVMKPGQRRPYDQLSPEEQRRLGSYATMGWLWEDVIRGILLATFASRVSGGRFECPGQLRLDGIYGTPDWYDTVDWRVEEFKATWRSSRRPLDPDFWHWLVQIKAYCHMLKSTRAGLRVFYVNGDYRESGPQVKHFHLEFSELELDDNWAMLKNHAKAQGWIK